MRDWRMTFLPQFKACVDAGSWSLMCSFNRYYILVYNVLYIMLYLIYIVLMVFQHVLIKNYLLILQEMSGDLKDM